MTKLLLLGVALALGACGGPDLEPSGDDPAARAGSRIGWQGEGDSCDLILVAADFACSGDLVCQPRDYELTYTVWTSDKDYLPPGATRIQGDVVNTMPVDYRCGRKARQGDYCASDSHCEVGLSCQRQPTPMRISIRGEPLHSEDILVPSCQP